METQIFQHHTTRNSRNVVYFYLFLCAIALAHTYSIYTTTGIFNYTFIDYRVWYSAGQVISNYGFDRLYDLELLTQYQQTLDKYSGYTSIVTHPTDVTISVLPYVYPSIFATLLFFTGKLPLSIEAAILALLFTFFSGFSLYLMCSDENKKNYKSSVNSFDLIAATVLSSGGFFSLIFLNPSILLSGFCSIGLLLHQKKMPIYSGLAFSLCILKPNVAIWILIGLFVSGQIKAAVSMLLGSLTLLVSSIFISGVDAIYSWISILSNYKSDYGNWAESMPNIRMVYLRIMQLTDSTLAATCISSLTAIIIFGVALNIILSNRKNYALCLLCFSILSVVLSIHSHIHTLSVILPFLIFYFIQVNTNKIVHLGFLYAPLVVFLVADCIYLDLAIAHISCAICAVATCIAYLFFLRHNARLACVSS